VELVREVKGGGKRGEKNRNVKNEDGCVFSRFVGSVAGSKQTGAASG
jgi:hypothetical protein